MGAGEDCVDGVCEAPLECFGEGGAGFGAVLFLHAEEAVGYSVGIGFGAVAWFGGWVCVGLCFVVDGGVGGGGGGVVDFVSGTSSVVEDEPWFTDCSLVVVGGCDALREVLSQSGCEGSAS